MPMTNQISRDELRSAIADKLCAHFGVTAETATDEQVFQAAAIVIREILSRLHTFDSRTAPEREVHYLSMEFLMGRSLMKDAFNLGIGDALTGTAPELIRHYLEVRGIGVVDVQKLFGMSGVKSSTQIDLVIQFERWQDDKFYDRLGLDEAHTQIMGVSLPLLTIPVSAGRNLAGIVELAVMNNRQKKYGINSARDFVEQIDSHIDRKSQQ